MTVTLAILAGGRGKRLGGFAKGLLRYEGRTLIERLLDLRALADEVVLVTNEPARYARFGLRMVADVVAGKGAPGGVHAALVAARGDRVVAVACDMPFVRPEAVAVLLAGDAEIAVFGDGKRLEPFPGVYAKSLAARWEAALASDPSMQSLCRRFPLAEVPLERLRAIDPEARTLVSVNTPEDLRSLKIEAPSEEDAGPSA